MSEDIKEVVAEAPKLSTFYRAVQALLLEGEFKGAYCKLVVEAINGLEALALRAAEKEPQPEPEPEAPAPELTIVKDEEKIEEPS